MSADQASRRTLPTNLTFAQMGAKSVATLADQAGQPSLLSVRTRATELDARYLAGLPSLGGLPLV